MCAKHWLTWRQQTGLIRITSTLQKQDFDPWPLPCSIFLNVQSQIDFISDTQPNEVWIEAYCPWQHITIKWMGKKKQIDDELCTGFLSSEFRVQKNVACASLKCLVFLRNCLFTRVFEKKVLLFVKRERRRLYRHALELTVEVNTTHSSKANKLLFLIPAISAHPLWGRSIITEKR